MCKSSNFNSKNFINGNINETYVKEFFIEKLITKVLQELENIIENNSKNYNDKDDYKTYLNKNIGKFYKEQIIPNVYFIFILILSSIESGDKINFNHNIDKSKIASIFFYPFIWMKPLGENRARYEKDFQKIFSKDEIEKLNMRNVFYKKKIKNIVDSNLSLSNNEIKNNIESENHEVNEISENNNSSIKRNKTYSFSKYSESGKFGEDYYKNFLNLLNYSNDFFEDIEISIYDNLTANNKDWVFNVKIIRELIYDLIFDLESKKGFIALLRQAYLLGNLRTNLVSIYLIIFLQEKEFIIGVFGKKKAGKSTFIKIVFKECEANNSDANSTMGLNFYTIKDTENFAILDSPGDTEIEESLKNFASKGYLYTKMLIYMMSEVKILDDDSMGKNKYLKILLELKVKYKIPLLIFLTHSDDYCDSIKKNEKEWESICKDNLEKNKKDLLNYLQQLIEKNYNSNFTINESDIMHIVLVDSKQMSDEEIIKKLSKKMKEKYDKGDEEKKKEILEDYRDISDEKDNESHNFLKKEMKVLYPKELIKTIKEKLPSQYHSALNKVD